MRDDKKLEFQKKSHDLYRHVKINFAVKLPKEEKYGLMS
jgi:hypothetical protein